MIRVEARSLSVYPRATGSNVAHGRVALTTSGQRLKGEPFVKRVSLIMPLVQMDQMETKQTEQEQHTE